MARPTIGANLRRLWSVARNIPGPLLGYPLHVKAEKLRLIDRAFRDARPSAKSFADLGGVWNVNGAYSRYALKRHALDRGVLVDTDFPEGLAQELTGIPRLEVVKGDFSDPDVVRRVGNVDVVLLFDVLLHQSNPSWREILSMYAERASCIAIYNQQYVLGESSVRLTDLPLEKYISLAPQGREELYRYVYAHADEIHPVYGKPWRDIHNIFQWGITDRDLRAAMAGLDFREFSYRNHGRFSKLPAFENHSFIFVRESRRG
jgi:hypothetical protein